MTDEHDGPQDGLVTGGGSPQVDLDPAEVTSHVTDDPEDWPQSYAVNGEAAPPAEDVPENLYGGVADFVEQFLVIVYARKVSSQRQDFRWCPRWWEHPEAFSRLEALWKAFETLRQDPGTGAAVWWRDFADTTMDRLCSSEGAFRQCSDTTHRVLPDLPYIKAPAWLREPL